MVAHVGVLTCLVSAPVFAQPAPDQPCVLPSPIVYLAQPALPPFEFVDPQGHPEGFNVELIRRVAAESGLAIEVRPTPWPQVLAALDRGEPVLASLAHTSERELRYALMASTATVRLGSFFPATTAPVPTAIADLGRYTVAVERDTMGEAVLEGLPAGERPRLVLVGSKLEGIDAVLAGRADGAAGSSAGIRWSERQRNTGLPIEVPIWSTPLFLSTARQCGPAFAPVVAALQRLHQTGVVEQMSSDWLRSHPHVDLATWRVAQLAGGLVTLTVGLVMGWNWTLRRRVGQRTREMERALEARQRMAERAMRTEARLSEALDAIEEGVWEWSTDGDWEELWVSPRWSKLSGYGPEQLPRNLAGWLAWLHPDDRDRIVAAHVRATESAEGLFEETYRMGTRDRGYCWFHDRGRIVERSADGAPRRMVGVVRDVTEEHAAAEVLRAAKEAAEEAARAKSTFLATMSHEIRTPLNAVIGASDLLGGTALDVSQQELVAVIQSSGDGLLALVDDVLDFSKIEAGRVELEARVFDPRALVADAARIVGPASTQKGLRLETGVAPAVPAWLRGD
ncbi:MAG: transporter substrate-binding domain-containing protein, partial [Vicinamibacterales bacterium]